MSRYADPSDQPGYFEPSKREAAADHAEKTVDQSTAERQAAALERIAAALEAMNARNSAMDTAAVHRSHHDQRPS